MIRLDFPSSRMIVRHNLIFHLYDLIITERYPIRLTSLINNDCSVSIKHNSCFKGLIHTNILLYISDSFCECFIFSVASRQLCNAINFISQRSFLPSAADILFLGLRFLTLLNDFDRRFFCVRFCFSNQSLNHFFGFNHFIAIRTIIACKSFCKELIYIGTSIIS